MLCRNVIGDTINKRNNVAIFKTMNLEALEFYNTCLCKQMFKRFILNKWTVSCCSLIIVYSILLYANYPESDIYETLEVASNDMKFVLLWTPHDWAPFNYLGHGNKSFISNNCSNTNCYVTWNRNFFGDDITKFHAIAFNGRNIDTLKQAYLPKIRGSHQKYIYFNTESSVNYPVCSDHLDDFFNLTATYKLNSDIVYSYFVIENAQGDVVGPKENMDWTDVRDHVTNTKDHDYYSNVPGNKTKAAAWFVSNCHKGDLTRFNIAEDLQRELNLHYHSVDVHGSCGTLTCSRDQQSSCNRKLKEDYFFYLAFENSQAEDYVTEKVLTALQNDIVPIVFGGADYSRFLPPHSYLDAHLYSVQNLASVMLKLMNSPNAYREYFKWKKYYTYYDSKSNRNVCSLCETLNNKKLMESETVYRKFREWWNADFRRACGL